MTVPGGNDDLPLVRRRLGRQPSLDGVRGLAIALVLLHHVLAFLAPARLQPWILPGGFIGVDIFFVLSGFLITALLLEEADAGPVRIGRFYLRRALRLFPALVVLLMGVSVANHLAGEPLRTTLRSAAAVGLYATNWVKTFGADVSPGLGHTWSLAVEEQFYLVWPVVVGLAVRRYGWSTRRCLVVLLGLASCSAVWRAVLWHQHPVVEAVQFRTDARADGLLIGAALAVAWHRGLAMRAARRLLPAAVLTLTAVVLVAPRSPEWLFLARSAAVPPAAAVLVAAVLTGSDGTARRTARALRWAPARWMGRVSYSVYLWHVAVILVAQRCPGPWWARAAVAVAGSLVVGQLSRTFVEQPFLRLKDRAEPRAVRRARRGSPEGAAIS